LFSVCFRSGKWNFSIRTRFPWTRCTISQSIYALWCVPAADREETEDARARPTHRSVHETDVAARRVRSVRRTTCKYVVLLDNVCTRVRALVEGVNVRLSRSATSKSSTYVFQSRSAFGFGKTSSCKIPERIPIFYPPRFHLYRFRNEHFIQAMYLFL